MPPTCPAAIDLRGAAFKKAILLSLHRISAHEVFREGAENSARGGRAPHATSEFGLKSMAVPSSPRTLHAFCDSNDQVAAV